MFWHEKVDRRHTYNDEESTQTSAQRTISKINVVLLMCVTLSSINYYTKIILQFG